MSRACAAASLGFRSTSTSSLHAPWSVMAYAAVLPTMPAPTTAIFISTDPASDGHEDAELVELEEPRVGQLHVVLAREALAHLLDGLAWASIKEEPAGGQGAGPAIF